MRSKSLYVIIACLVVVLVALFYVLGQRKESPAQGGSGASAPEKTASPGRKQSRTVPGVDMAFVYVRPGSFKMGTDRSRVYQFEKPVHKVSFDKGFWIGKHEVTLGQYRRFLKATGNEKGVDWDADSSPFRNKDGYPLADHKFAKNARQPLIQVSWRAAVRFCDWLTEREQQNGRLPDRYEYRLPTEAEWEYAARGGAGGEDTKYSGGDDLDKVAWCGHDIERTHKVAQKQPNALDVYDMTGNVWEWCRDRWHRNYKGAPTDGSAWMKNTDSPYRVLRGWGWNSDRDHSFVTYRNYEEPSVTLYDIGFRVVLAPVR